MSKLFFLLILALLSMGGCGKKDEIPNTGSRQHNPDQSAKPVLPRPTGGFAIVVGDEVVTADDVVTPDVVERAKVIANGRDLDTFSRNSRTAVEQLITSRLTNIVLYNQARTEFGDKLDDGLEKAAEQEVRKFVAGFGGDYARAEHALQQMDMDWTGFKDYQKKMILSQYYLSSKVPEAPPVTYTMLVNEYEKLKDELFTSPAIITFRLIDIEVAKVRQSDPSESRLVAARRQAQEVLEQVHSGADFGELAKKHSHGHRRALGGLWNPVCPDSLARPYDILSVYAAGTEVGEVSSPIEADGHIFIMKLEDKQAETVEPLERVQNQLEAKIQLAWRRKALDELGSRIVEQATAGSKEAFVEFCVAELYRRANKAAEQ